jgi:periplasmic protein TonB
MSQFETTLRISLRMWALAVLGAATIHVICIALAREYLRDDDLEAELGAPAIEIGVELLAERREPIDLPPGPDVQESVASPQALDQVPTEPPVLPRQVPVETDRAELAVTPVETKKPKEDEPVLAPAPVNPAAPAITARAMARPSSEIAQESPRSTTPAQGTGESMRRVRAAWQNELMAHFDRYKRYPGHSLESATVLVNFVIDETGCVLSSRVVRGSGDASLDEAALAMIRRSDPVPKPPLAVAQDPLLVVPEGLSFTMPVIFRVKHAN